MWPIFVPMAVWTSLLVAQANPVGWEEFERDCKRGVHIQCLRQGIRLVRSGKLSRSQKTIVFQRLAMAYDSIGQAQQTSIALQRLLKNAPCQRRFPLLDDEIKGKLKKARARLFEQDTAPPLMTHVAPSREVFLRSPMLTAQVNDDLGVSEVAVFYRLREKGDFTKRRMSRSKGNLFTFQVPRTILRGRQRFEYFLRARDCVGRSSYTVKSTKSPQVIFLEIPVKVEPNRVFGNVLLGVGVVSLLGGTLSFYTAFSTLQRWNDVKDIAASEVLREEIILYHVIGWVGVGVGLVSLGVGGFLSFRPPQTRNRSTLPSDSLPPKKGQSSSVRLLRLRSL